MQTSLFSPSEVSYSTVPLTSASASASASTSSSTAAAALLRSDARQPLAYRDIHLESDVTEGTVGSAKVRIGNASNYTEVWAGVRGEIEDLAEGEQGGKVVVSVECAPTALPTLRADLPIHLATLLTTLFSSQSLPPSLLSQLLVLPHKKAWTLYLDVLILSSSAGNVLDLAIMAARSALAATRIPKTQPIGYDDDDQGGATGEAVRDSGITGLVKGGKGGVNAVDFELVDGGWEDGERLEGWEQLPVALTLNLIHQLPHLDATVLEEASTGSQLVVCFNASGDLTGVSQLGAGEIEFARIMPLIKDAGGYAKELIGLLNDKLRSI